VRRARASGRAVGGPPGAIAIAGACGGEGGSPAPAGARSEALQGRLQSLLRRARAGRRVVECLRTIARFRHQDVHTPPSPRVGEGGRGDEGAQTPPPFD